MGRIHPQAERQHFDGNQEHREVVRPFLSCFEVTRGFWRSRGADRLACFFLKPEKFIAEHIGLEREMLLAYAPFPEFQARTIKLHDSVLDEDRLRLDPMGSILVSDCPRTDQAIAEYLLSEPERPPIIGLSKSQLNNLRNADDLRDLFCRELFKRDLFALESPLRTDTTFLGRADVVSSLLDRFRSGQNSGLFGLRRIGKTSVLYALQRRIRNSRLGAAHYLDLSNPSRYQARWWSLLQEIVKSFASPLNLERSQRSKIRALTLDYDEINAARHAEADINALATHVPDGRLVILLDEIESITYSVSPSPVWEGDFLPFWQTLRSLHQDSEGRFTFVVAGVNPRVLELDRVGSYDNPLFSTVKPFYLQPFDRDTLREMVRKISRYMGLRFDESLYDLFHSDYGGHPFLVRQACSNLVAHISARPAVVDKDTFYRERRKIALALDRGVRQILNILAIWYPEEYELLAELAKGNIRDFVEFASLSATFTQHVEGYGLVRSAREQPTITVGLVAEHLKRQQLPAKLFESGEDRDEVLAEISRRRNRIEDRLRKVLRDGIRFFAGKRAASEALGCLPKERSAVLAQFGYDEMWKEFYFNELIEVVRKHWQAFQNYFSTDRDRILRWLEQINECRVDAHAKSLSDEDLAFLRVSFRRIEELLDLNAA